MSAEELAREFSNRSLRSAFADFLGEPAPEANQQASSFHPGETLAAFFEFNFEGTMQIDGCASTTFRSRNGKLIVGETADLRADIFVATAIIDGELRGNISATERVQLGSHARVMGNIETPKISIEPGALFDGECHFPPPISNSRKSETGRLPGASSNAAEPGSQSTFEDAPQLMTANSTR